MLKPADQGAVPEPERPVGDLVHQLVDEGKAYAQAELALAKAIASAKARAVALPAALLVAAFMIAQAGINAVAVGVFAALYWQFGPILAGIIAMLIFAALAGGLGWYALKRVRRDL